MIIVDRQFRPNPLYHNDNSVYSTAAESDVRDVGPAAAAEATWVVLRGVKTRARTIVDRQFTAKLLFSFQQKDRDDG